MKMTVFFQNHFYFLCSFFLLNLSCVTKKVSSDEPKNKKVSLRSLREEFVNLMVHSISLIQKILAEEMNKKECNKQKITDVLILFEWTASQIQLFHQDPASYSRSDLELNTEKAEKNLLYLQNITINK
jgi:hypothetical protein